MEGTARLDSYLSELQARLHGLPEPEVLDIVAELRSHVRDAAGASGASGETAVESVLERLGSARELAALYHDQSRLARAAHGRSPWLLIRTLFRAAAVSVAAFWALLGLFAGYALATILLLAAVMKPIAPDRVGLWRLGPDSVSLRLGLGSGAPAGQELLGIWIVPLGLLCGFLGLQLTTWFGTRCVRRLRRSPLGVPRGDFA